jgi:periplasmic protein CpxP/Spy
MKSKLSSVLFSAMLAASTLLAVQARAEDGAGGPPPAGEKQKGPRPGERLKQMAEKLDLSDEQVAKIKAIFEAEAQEIKALRKDGEPTPEKREQMKAIREKIKAEIDAVLTPEQREKAEAMRAKHAEGQKNLKSGKEGKKEKGPKGPKGDKGDMPPPPAE